MSETTGESPDSADTASTNPQEDSPLDGLEPLDALCRVTLQMAHELTAWSCFTEFTKADLGTTQQNMVASIRATVQRFNQVFKDFQDRVNPLLPELQRVHAPKIVEVGFDCSTCYTEAIGRIFNQLYNAFRFATEPDLLGKWNREINADLVLERWDDVRERIRSSVGVHSDYLRANLRQEFFVAREGRQRLAPPALANSILPVRANTAKLFPKGVPQNSNIVDLVARLDSAKGSGRSQISIAREFFGESEGHDPKSRSHLSQIRRMRRKGRLAL